MAWVVARRGATRDKRRADGALPLGQGAAASGWALEERGRI
jgi:hypothetical protein